MKLQQSGEGFWLYVPTELVSLFDWKKGDFFYPVPIEYGKGIQYIRITPKRKPKDIDDDKKMRERK